MDLLIDESGFAFSYYELNFKNEGVDTSTYASITNVITYTTLHLLLRS